MQCALPGAGPGFRGHLVVNRTEPRPASLNGRMALRLKARLWPMRGLKRRRSARIIAAGHAVVQNLRRGRYELGADIPDRRSNRRAFDPLAVTI